MNRYKIVTLIDITKSNASRTESDKIKIGQQSNFNSLLQSIGIRSNIQWFDDPVMYSGRLPADIDGAANHWIWEFGVEQADVFLKEIDPVGLLKDDLDGVPVVIDLNNNVDINPPIFKTKGNDINTWLYKINS